ncbi:uncharacterized protein V1510DRAFT_420741 [Dipodascopsis tothii]|uniref:uncharacterized protein n=1 Tax=Dipodascopsis tothii TaxID=44089 RepID=UPI0034CF11F4
MALRPPCCVRRQQRRRLPLFCRAHPSGPLVSILFLSLLEFWLCVCLRLHAFAFCVCLFLAISLFFFFIFRSELSTLYYGFLLPFGVT